MTNAAPEPDGSEDAPEPDGSEDAPEPDGSEDETRRKFREALERKRANDADANAARRGQDAGKIHGARGLARSRRTFRRKTGS